MPGKISKLLGFTVIVASEGDSMIPKNPSEGAGSLRGVEKFDGSLGSKLLYERAVRALVATGGKVVVFVERSMTAGILER